MDDHITEVERALYNDLCKDGPLGEKGCADCGAEKARVLLHTFQDQITEKEQIIAAAVSLLRKVQKAGIKARKTCPTGMCDQCSNKECPRQVLRRDISNFIEKHKNIPLREVEGG